MSKNTAVKVTFRLQTPSRTLHIIGNIVQVFNTTQEREEMKDKLIAAKGRCPTRLATNHQWQFDSFENLDMQDHISARRYDSQYY